MTTPLDRAVDAAIARENRNPQGLPPEDVAAQDAIVVSPTPPKTVSAREAMEYAADALAREEVQYAMGIDSDHLDNSFVREDDGTERPRTEADLAEEQAEIDAVVLTLRRLVELLAALDSE